MFVVFVLTRWWKERWGRKYTTLRGGRWGGEDEEALRRLSGAEARWWSWKLAWENLVLCPFFFFRGLMMIFVLKTLPWIFPFLLLLEHCILVALDLFDYTGIDALFDACWNVFLLPIAFWPVMKISEATSFLFSIAHFAFGCVCGLWWRDSEAHGLVLIQVRLFGLGRLWWF